MIAEGTTQIHQCLIFLAKLIGEVSMMMGQEELVMFREENGQMEDTAVSIIIIIINKSCNAHVSTLLGVQGTEAFLSSMGTIFQSFHPHDIHYQNN